MLMPMMNIRVMRVPMRQHLMPMQMHMRLHAIPRECMLMPVMLVVPMPM
jgi:hypothetical protein